MSLLKVWWILLAIMMVGTGSFFYWLIPATPVTTRPSPLFGIPFNIFTSIIAPLIVAPLWSLAALDIWWQERKEKKKMERVKKFADRLK